MVFSPSIRSLALTTSGGGGWAAPRAGNETFERVASFGMTTNLTVYLVKRYHMGTVAAANLTNIWNGTTNFAPLLGAFVSDAYWGKFNTLVFACVATFLVRTHTQPPPRTPITVRSYGSYGPQ